MARIVYAPCVLVIFTVLVLQFSHGFILDGTEDFASCGAVLHARLSEESYVDSPGFPEPYPNEADCFWEIAGPPGSRVLLRSEYFAVEDQPECLWDYLSVEDGARGEYGRMVYCGQKELDFVSESNLVTLTFHSDVSGAESGFRISYTAVSRQPAGDGLTCNRTLREEGEITSPDHPGSYPPEADCSYLLQAPPDHRARLSFSEFHVESYPCEFDMLRVYDGPSTADDHLIETFCGRLVPPPVISTTNSMALRFTSDSSIEFSGFKAKVEFIPSLAAETSFTSTRPTPPPSTTSETTIGTTTPVASSSSLPVTEAEPAPARVKASETGCNITITSAAANITSPGYPGEYPHDTVCVTKLRSHVVMSFLVRFPYFSLEESENCSYDSLSIYPVAPTSRHTVPPSSSSSSSSQAPPPPPPAAMGHATAASAAGGAVSLERIEPPLRVMCGMVSYQEAVLSWEGLGLDIVFRSDKSVSGTGFLLETLIAPLDDGPQCTDICQNGGSCLEIVLPDGAIDWECACAEGYTGHMCQTELPGTCEDIVCHNGGVCTETRGDPFCACPAGFGREFCEETTDSEGNALMYFTKISSNTSVSVGSAVILECAVSDPEAQVMWLFHDRILTSAERSRGVQLLPGGVVVIQEVKDAHAGKYTCMATTQRDLVEESLWLTLTEPCSLRVHEAPANLTLKEGSPTAMFQCFIPDADVIFWRKDGDIIEPGDRKQILVNNFLVLKDVLETDAGEYTCAARARSGCFAQVSAYLTVLPSGHRQACGQAKTPYQELQTGRISMGHQAIEGSAPWHVLMREPVNETTFCGGSLISADTVLTAAHCIVHFPINYNYPFDLKKIRLYMGTHQCAGQGGIEREIESYIIHEGFNKTQFDNDIALLKLREPVEFSVNVSPICLETPEFVNELRRPGRMGVVTGCGKGKFKYPLPTFLNEVKVPYVSREVCGERAEVVDLVFTEGMFCAGYPRSYRGDACGGDSGGPYVMQFHGRAIQVGIVSWGVGCDMDNHYGYYTNLAHYYDWIIDRLD